MTKKIIFKLPILGEIEVVVSRLEVAEFAMRQMAMYYKSCAECDENIHGTKITITNKTFLGTAKTFFNNNCTLARSFKIRDNRVVFSGLEYELTNDKLIIQCLHHDKKPKWYKKPKQLEYPECHIRFYNQILFPVFSLYTILDGYYLLHGSLIEYNDKTFIISGLDGVGKSSLSNLFAQMGAKIYSDNFVLFNGEKAVPFNLAIRLEPNQQTHMRELFRNKELKEVLYPSNRTTSLNIDYIVVLCIGEKVALSNRGGNLSALSLFCNNAPEICAANQVIAPFLYKHTNKNIKTNIRIKKLSIPLGKLEQGMEVLKNEH